MHDIIILYIIQLNLVKTNTLNVNVWFTQTILPVSVDFCINVVLTSLVNTNTDISEKFRGREFVVLQTGAVVNIYIH